MLLTMKWILEIVIMTIYSKRFNCSTCRFTLHIYGFLYNNLTLWSMETTSRLLEMLFHAVRWIQIVLIYVLYTMRLFLNDKNDHILSGTQVSRSSEAIYSKVIFIFEEAKLGIGNHIIHLKVPTSILEMYGVYNSF